MVLAAHGRVTDGESGRKALVNGIGVVSLTNHGLLADLRHFDVLAARV